MAKVEPFPDNRAKKSDSRIDAVTQAIQLLLEPLTPAEREEIIRAIRPDTTPRAGDVLDTVVRLLPKYVPWTVKQVRDEVAAAGIPATPKQVYNAVGYLRRRGLVRRLGYGRYLVDGVAMVTADDLGGEPTREETEE